jgi:phosphohistidine phosphatase
MKKIIFIRHGKAEEESPGISDFERSLTLRGKDVSRRMAIKLAEKEKSLGTLVTSPAFRALETALIFMGEYDINAEYLILNSSIYTGMSLRNLPCILSSINEDTNVVTLFGHNPSFSQIADNLSKEGCDFIPKSGVVCISFNILSWSEIKPDSGKIEYFLKPDNIL